MPCPRGVRRAPDVSFRPHFEFDRNLYVMLYQAFFPTTEVHAPSRPPREPRASSLPCCSAQVGAANDRRRQGDNERPQQTAYRAVRGTAARFRNILERINKSRLPEQIYRANMYDGKASKGCPKKSYAEQIGGIFKKEQLFKHPKPT
ncbi:hypothetical protein EVAR_14911_1 [Eumeta japonica]|uniref:Uncharacterized protein n=1 Tax=Eumeta variegata TaxID=151549 RepID=A0A4C1XML3_EUMVA|nr:hypothetical protein EVAR_14911_1 [Eumeta japonica]